VKYLLATIAVLLAVVGLLALALHVKHEQKALARGLGTIRDAGLEVRDAKDGEVAARMLRGDLPCVHPDLRDGLREAADAAERGDLDGAWHTLVYLSWAAQNRYDARAGALLDTIVRAVALLLALLVGLVVVQSLGLARARRRAARRLIMAREAGAQDVGAGIARKVGALADAIRQIEALVEDDRAKVAVNCAQKELSQLVRQLDLYATGARKHRLKDEIVNPRDHLS